MKGNFLVMLTKMHFIFGIFNLMIVDKKKKEVKKRKVQNSSEVKSNEFGGRRKKEIPERKGKNVFCRLYNFFFHFFNFCVV